MTITFIGLGEAASAFISGWGPARASQIRSFDIKSTVSATAGEIAERAASLGITSCDDPASALAGSELVFSTVTADQAVTAAESCAGHISPGAVWCDLNSCAPASKRKAASIIGDAGGRYLDVAVMAPVHPKLNLVPCLISGAPAVEMAPRLQDLPMDVRIVGEEVGRASSIKMVRSIAVKGLEALTAECALAAAAAGVSGEVFPSLKSGHPEIDLPARAAYNFERSLRHGTRRAAEMEEVAKMLADLGLPNGMSSATASWQRQLGGLDILHSDEPAHDLDWFVEHLLHALGVTKPVGGH